VVPELIESYRRRRKWARGGIGTSLCMSLLLDLVSDDFDTSRPVPRRPTPRLWAKTAKSVKTRFRGYSVPCFGLHDQSAAIELLPAPPEIKKSGKGSANGKVNGSSPAVPDLGAAWAKLPEKVKAEIVVMVNAAAKEGGVS
jgi:hypothetical protein